MTPRPARAQGTYYPFRKRRVFVPDGYLVVGQITSAHGLKGEVAVELHTDFPERFQPGITLYLGDALAPAAITQARPHKGNMLLQFEQSHSREDAESLRGLWLYIEEDEAAELEEGSYWIHDIIGLTVLSTDGSELGTISDVMATGANDVYIVQPALGVNNDRELLLPAIPEVVQTVDLDAGTMTVALLPGLLEEASTAPDAEQNAEAEVTEAEDTDSDTTPSASGTT